MKFKTINVNLPNHDCDVILKFPFGQVVYIQARPSNADVNYNGSLDIILPQDTAVTNWQGDDMQPAKQTKGHPERRIAKQLVIELPK